MPSESLPSPRDNPSLRDAAPAHAIRLRRILVFETLYLSEVPFTGAVVGGGQSIEGSGYEGVGARQRNLSGASRGDFRPADSMGRSLLVRHRDSGADPLEFPRNLDMLCEDFGAQQ